MVVTAQHAGLYFQCLFRLLPRRFQANAAFQIRRSADGHFPARSLRQRTSVHYGVHVPGADFFPIAKVRSIAQRRIQPT